MNKRIIPISKLYHAASITGASPYNLVKRFVVYREAYEIENKNGQRCENCQHRRSVPYSEENERREQCETIGVNRSHSADIKLKNICTWFSKINDDNKGDEDGSND